MSYESENILLEKASLNSVIEVIELLGYIKYKDELRMPNQVAAYFWTEDKNYKSYVGVELSIYKNNRIISVYTRTRIGRSYWDLQKQNKTISLLRRLFGGSFVTDEGKSRYMKEGKDHPSPLESGLFIQRWIFNNALVKPRLYLNLRDMKGDVAKNESTGFHWLDDLNPRLFSNNLIIPYLVGIWENYLKSSYIVLLSCNLENRTKVFKNSRLLADDLENISRGIVSVEEAIANRLSFQQPSIVVNNYKSLDKDIDLGMVLKKPYRNRKTSLYREIEKYVFVRNEFVHTGAIDISIYDKDINKIVDCFEDAVDKIYDYFGEYYGYKLSKNF